MTRPKSATNRICLAVALMGSTLGGVVPMVGCQSDHRMRTGGENKVTVCRECYDKAITVWDQGRYPGWHSEYSRNSAYSGGRWGYIPSKRVHVEHQCASCNATMVVHTDDGRWTIQCPTCAPKGVPCDKCLPGDGVIERAPAK